MPEPLDRAQRAIDWEAIERSPEFRELVRPPAELRDPVHGLLPRLVPRLHPARARTRPTSWASRVYEGLTVGYCLALTQFVMVFVPRPLVPAQGRPRFDPLAERAIAAYADDQDAEPAGRPLRARPAAPTARTAHGEASR